MSGPVYIPCGLIISLANFHLFLLLLSLNVTKSIHHLSTTYVFLHLGPWANSLCKLPPPATCLVDQIDFFLDQVVRDQKGVRPTGKWKMKADERMTRPHGNG